MSETLCEKYGFDSEGRKRRLALVRLDNSDRELANQFQQLIVAPHIDKLVTEFYDFLLGHPQSRQFLNTATRIEQVKQTQTEYLLNLGVNFDSQDYFEGRLHIGLVHVSIGLPLSLYQCAYAWFRERIGFLIRHHSNLDETSREAMQSFLVRITALDETLATETYYFERVTELEASISSMAVERDKLSREVDRDSLTRVASRQHILNHLERCLAEVPLDKDTFGLLMVDLDHFKDINDSRGHLAGDDVLREVANRIQAAVREVDVVGRFGGEEFLLILPGTPLQMAVQIAERIRQSVGATPVHCKDTTVSVTLSVGVTQAIASDTQETIIGRADYALYQAKESGRNRVNVL